MQEPSIFTKIINGEIPSHKIYENDITLAFLDIMPATRGHVLVIPKRQVEFVWDLTEKEYSALMSTARMVALRIRETLKPAYVGELIVGTDVPHAHVHVLPFEQSIEIKDALGAQRSLVDDADLQSVAELLRFE